jgi:hypothetical protein
MPGYGNRSKAGSAGAAAGLRYNKEGLASGPIRKGDLIVQGLLAGGLNTLSIQRVIARRGDFYETTYVAKGAGLAGQRFSMPVKLALKVLPSFAAPYIETGL